MYIYMYIYIHIYRSGHSMSHVIRIPHLQEVSEIDPGIQL
jgi:hypothetical protein